MADTKHIRLFVAIELPREVLEQLGATIAAMRALAGDEGIRWVRPEGMHLTLKFLGETDEEDLPGIMAVLRDVGRLHAPIALQIDHINGMHGRRHEPYEYRWTREGYHHNLRLVYAAVGGDVAPLATLANSLADALEPLGFAPEKRAIFGHVTLGRVKERADRDTRIELYHSLSPFLASSLRGRRSPLLPEIPSFRATAFSLMESKLQRGGALYRQVASFPLEAR